MGEVGIDYGDEPLTFGRAFFRTLGWFDAHPAIFIGLGVTLMILFLWRLSKGDRSC